jgi:signal transduction histidine kinase
VTTRSVRLACIALLVAAWILDLITPQLLIVAILLNGPIALSSLASDSRFTRVLVGLALLADGTGGYFNGVLEHHWDAIALWNRVLVALSLVLVGGLSIAAQQAALRAGEALAREARASRERDLRRAVESVRASINTELIARSALRGALDALHANRALIYLFDETRGVFATYDASGDALHVASDRPPPPVLSLLERIAESRAVERVGVADPVARFALAALGAPHAIGVALAEHDQLFGVLMLLRGQSAFEEHFEEGLRYYADQAGIALAQAALFAQLADRNEALAAANASLHAQSEVIRDIVYALSHDLRTPLAAASLTLRQALDGAFGALPAAYREILERTVRSNEELQRLAETLLLVSRYESGDASPRHDLVDLAALARSVADELKPLWEEKRLNVRAEDDGEVVVTGDPSELRRTLVNLLANAVKFTPAGGEITVRVSHRDRASVVVEDSGYGVDAADRATLFERGHGDARRVGSGSGLGLYLVRRVVEGHGGRVGYAPREGGGSTFSMELPLSPETALLR